MYFKVVLGCRGFSVNACYRIGKHGNMYKTPLAHEYQDGIRQALRDKGVEMFPDNERLRVDLCFKFSRKYNIDLDNMFKPLLDALQGVVYHNDSQIYSISATKEFTDVDEIVIEVTTMRQSKAAIAAPSV
jgi:Holliday junction resolvase RusA-like endonuclease